MRAYSLRWRYLFGMVIVLVACITAETVSAGPMLLRGVQKPSQNNNGQNNNEDSKLNDAVKKEKSLSSPLRGYKISKDPTNGQKIEPETHMW